MRHNKALQILFLIAFLMNALPGHSATKSTGSAAAGFVTASAMNSVADQSIPDMAVPLHAATRPDHHSKKTHSPKLEEVAHIHHFHKERVKKLKKHQKKCWAFSKIILVLIHIALLVMAYSHVTH